MDIDTSLCRQYAGRIHALRSQFFFTERVLADRHQTILAQIESLRQFFLNMANQAEANENRRLSMSSYSSLGNASVDPDLDLHLFSQILRKDVPMSVGASFGASYLHTGSSFRAKYLENTNHVDVGNAQASGECSLNLWTKDKKFDPSLSLAAQVGVSLLDVSSRTKIGTDQINAVLNLNGSVGTAKASASAVLSRHEQSFKAQAHVAALEGEAKLAFNIFGVSVSLTTSGSLMSAGADVSYEHKNREWEFGAKLGFIAGLGFKLNVKY